MAEPIYTDKDYLDGQFKSLHARLDDEAEARRELDERYHEAVFTPKTGLNDRMTKAESRLNWHERVGAAVWAAILALAGSFVSGRG